MRFPPLGSKIALGGEILTIVKHGRKYATAQMPTGEEIKVDMGSEFVKRL